MPCSYVMYLQSIKWTSEMPAYSMSCGNFTHIRKNGIFTSMFGTLWVYSNTWVECLFFSSPISIFLHSGDFFGSTVDIQFGGFVLNLQLAAFCSSLSSLLLLVLKKLYCHEGRHKKNWNHITSFGSIIFHMFVSLSGTPFSGQCPFNVFPLSIFVQF